MSFCIKCNNVYNFIPKGNKLNKECRICSYTEVAKETEYKILVEKFDTEYENYEYFLQLICDDPTYPRIEHNGKIYTIIIEPKSLNRLYIDNETKKAYNKL